MTTTAPLPLEMNAATPASATLPAPRPHQSLRLASGRQLGYAQYGDPNGRPLIFLHGWPGCRLQPSHSHAELVRQGFRLIAPDRPGIGLSERQGGRRITDWPEVLAELADRLGLGTFDLWAVSGGCPYALATAWALPERVSKVAIHCGAPPLADFPSVDDIMPTFRALMALRRHLPSLQVPVISLARLYLLNMPERICLPAVYGVTPQPDQRAIRQPGVLSCVTATTREAYRAGARGVIEDGALYLEKWGFPYAAITRPVHFWHGEQDGTLPIQKTRWLAERIPGAHFTAYPQEGHYSLPINQSRPLLEWLAQP